MTGWTYIQVQSRHYVMAGNILSEKKSLVASFPDPLFRAVERIPIVDGNSSC